MKSEDFYDHLSSDYASLNGVSKYYLDAVNRVATHYINGARSWLDIGTGDGLRAASILESLHNRPQDIILCDNSAGMVKAAKRNLPQEIIAQWDMTTKTPFQTIQKFDVITLLGNILGHVHPEESRFKQLCAVRQHLADDGTLLLDFNNRWNSRAYGVFNVGANLFRDLIAKPRSTFTAKKCIAGRQISTPVYLGSPREYRLLLSKAGFHINRIIYHDYSTGALAGPSTGQGLIMARKENS